MEWVNALYEETKQKWEEAGKDKFGYSIFYSPVKENVRIALIGYNPGGVETPDMENIQVPVKHDYFEDNYKLAQKVKKIFESANILEELRESLKFNLIFFRSKKANDFVNKDLIHFCEKRVVEILERTRPKLVITEGFKTFDRLIFLKSGIQTGELKEGNRVIMKIGQFENGTVMLGMIHPSGARGISDAILFKLGAAIKKELEKKIYSAQV